MFVEEYKKANDSICISDEKKEELILKMKKQLCKKETRKLKTLGVLTAVVVIALVACIISITTDNKALKIDKTTSESDFSRDEMFFNKIDDEENKALNDIQFDVAGEGMYKRSELPKFIAAVLPNFSEEYEKNEGTFEALYSENWSEFYVNAATKAENKTVSICAERSNQKGEPIPQSWISSELSNSKYKVYLAENSNNGETVISANYLTDNGIMISLSTNEFEKDEFVGFVKKCLETG